MLLYPIQRRNNYYRHLSGARVSSQALYELPPIHLRHHQIDEGDIWDYVEQHNLPYNRLHDQNYPSVGCWPCTRAVQPGEDQRAGRWSGLDKTECGLHLVS